MANEQTNRRRILIVCPGLLEPFSSRGGGIEEVDRQIALCLSEAYDVTVIGPLHGGRKPRRIINEHLIIDHIHFPALPRYPLSRRSLIFHNIFHKPLYSVLLFARLARIIRSDVRLVLAHNGLAGATAVIASRLHGIEVLYSEGNTSPWTQPYFREPRRTIVNRIMLFYHSISGKFIAEFSDRVRAQSESIKAGMEKRGVPRDKIVVIPASIDGLRPLRACEANAAKRLFVVGFIGRLCEEKGISFLLELIDTAEKRMPDISFCIAGSGEHEETLREKKNVIHAGWVCRTDLMRLIDKMNCVVSFQKEPGIGEIEAMAAGKILVVGNEGEMPRLIEDKKNGLVCEPRVASYLHSIGLIQHNQVDTRAISMAARATATAYDRSSVCALWIDACE